MLNRFSLNMKMYGVVGFLALAIMAIAGMGLTKLDHMNQDLDRVVNSDYKRVRLLVQLRDAQRRVALRDSAILMTADEARAADLTKQRDEYYQEISEVSDSFAKDVNTTEAREAMATLSNSLTTYKQLVARMLELKHQGKMKEAVAIFDGEATQLRIESVALIEKSVKAQEELMTKAAAEAQIDSALARRQLLLLTVCALLLGGGLAAIILIALSRQIHRVVTGLNQSSNQVASASTEISHSAAGLAQASSEQAASLEETAASLQEITTMVRSNTENAEKTSTLAKSSHQSALRGKDVVDHMLEAITDIEQSNSQIGLKMDESNRRLVEIVKVIGDIGDKTRVINDIVFQTKLLSFNASVEAARAGEQGKGFAVVAEEVGSLAQMSGNAALEITKMLEESITKVEAIAEETKSGVEGLITQSKNKVMAGTRVAQECRGVLEEIVSSVESVLQMADSIARASSEQSEGLHQINRAMEQLDQVTQQNTTASEESASASHQLAAQAETLNTTVDALVTAVYGHRGSIRDMQPTPIGSKGRVVPLAA